MSDPIEQLNHFGDTFEGGPMQHHSAQAARQRGDTIRRRRTALVAAGSAAAVVAVAVPVFALANGGSGSADRNPVATGGPSTEAGPLTSANLLADREIPSGAFGTSWTTKDTYAGDTHGQDAASSCYREPLSSLGATGIRNRDWELAPTGDDQIDTLNKEDWLRESVAEFPDAQAAQTAYDEIAGATPECKLLASGYPDYRYQADAAADVAIPVDGRAQYFSAVYDNVSDPEGGGYTHFLETGLIVSGDRIAVLQRVYAGNGDAPQEMQDMITVAAQRLVTGEAPADDATVPPPATTDDATPDVDQGVTTTIPDDIPIDLDLVDMGSDGEYQEPEHVPASDFQPLTLCSTDVWPPAHVDALSAWATGPEYGDRRDVLSFASVDEAVAAVQAFRDTLADCTTQGDSVWNEHQADTGYDSVTFSQSCTGGPPCLTVYQATRVGNAVLLTSIYGEGSLDDISRVVPARTDITRNIATHLCVFTRDGCSGGDDSVSNEVPLGPDGYGDLVIGMTADEAVATGGLTLTDTDLGCQHFTLAGYPDQPNGTDGYITDRYGLESIFARPGMLTPEGIGIGSTIDELRAAYPDLGGSDGIYSKTLDNGNWYLFDVNDDKVTQVAVVAHRQSCFD